MRCKPYISKSLKKKAQSYFQKAQVLFEEARDYFLQANGFVSAEFPHETIVISFHIAEVGYYNRHIYDLLGSKKKKEDYLKKSLEKSLTAFEEVLTIAEGRNHERLIAHSHYYLGKVCRRLTRHFDGTKKENYFVDSSIHFDQALIKATAFSDFVLVARIKYAQGQWCEEKSQFVSKTEKNKYLEEAKRLVKDAATVLAELGMGIESMDAVAFLKDRLKATDMPDKLLEAYKRGYKEITA